jgi:NADPH:quinone reductase-like Zn-dependent oxidoreductase
MPVPGDDDIVIKNRALAINPADWKIQDYPSWLQTWPFLLGEDVAGEVYEVGKNVVKFKKGDRVMACVVSPFSSQCQLANIVLSHLDQLLTQDPQNGGFQYYTRTPAERAANIPDNISFIDASVIPLALNTAGHGLYGTDEGFLALPWPSLDASLIGKTILVWGGSSSVGALTIQLAVASGVKVVAVAGKSNHELVKSLGACEAVDYKGPNVVQTVLAAIANAGGTFAGIYDAISEECSYRYVCPIAEKLGVENVVVVNPPPRINVPMHVKFGKVIAVNDVTGPLWRNYVGPALEKGKLKPAPEALIIGNDLECIQKGMDMSKAGVSAKKIVVEL